MVPIPGSCCRRKCPAWARSGSQNRKPSHTQVSTGTSTSGARKAHSPPLSESQPLINLQKLSPARISRVLLQNKTYADYVLPHLTPFRWQLEHFTEISRFAAVRQRSLFNFDELDT